MSEQLFQGYLVYRQGDIFRVRGQINGQELLCTEHANEAIQQAIDAVSEGGGEVTLSRGTFPLQTSVRLADNVRFRGAGRGTILRVANTVEAGLIGRSRKGLDIAQLALTTDNGAGAGLILDDCGDCKIHDVLAVGFRDYGFWIRNNTFLSEIRGCTLAGNGKANLYLEKLSRGRHGDFLPNLVTNCIIYGGGKGVETNNVIVLNIVACAVYQTRDIAYHLHTNSNSVLISGCRSFQIGSHAVVSESTHELNLSSNIFCWHTGHGIVINDCGWGTICGNEIIDTGSYNPGVKDFTTKQADVPADVPLYCGIRLSNARGFNISGNTIFNWPQARKMRMGVAEDDTCYQNNFIGNSINYVQEAGILAQGRGSRVSDNLIEEQVPHYGRRGEEMLQSFQPELTEQFIQRLLPNE